MTKGKWQTVGWCSLIMPYLVEWHCEVELNGQTIKMTYIGTTKLEAKKKFKELINDRIK